MHPAHVLADAVRRGEAGRADGAGEGLLTSVLPLVAVQSLLHGLITIDLFIIYFIKSFVIKSLRYTRETYD